MSARLPVSKPSDIGAADVSKRNHFRTEPEAGGMQEIHGNLRLWRIDPQVTTAIYFAGETPQGLQPYGDIINMGIDDNGFAVLAYTDHLTGAGVDRINIGSEPPNRVGIGGYANANVPGGAFLLLQCANTDPTEPACHIVHQPGQIGDILTILDGTSGVRDLRLDGGSNLHVKGNVMPMVSGGARVGDPAHAFQSVVLSDGTAEWMVTVDSSGVLHAAKVRTNYVINPRFVDVAAQGRPGGWAFTALGAPTYTWTTMLVDGVTRPAVRVQYSCQAGDSGGVIFACPPSPAGSLANGDAVSASAYLVTNCVGVTVALYHQTNTGQNIGPTSVTLIQPTPTRFKVNGTASGATTNLSKFLFWISGAGAGDTIDFTIAAPMIEKAADAGTYFDGGDAGCAWAGLTDYSVSKKG